ncbi:MAG: hypothetical protein GTN53_25145, partial [Candidatus Aminicenantes bacterium]|nr:hypothetical protein [Candidatus Aminicenantes bacterium]NIQ69776.1 hypothetical protein [Candidatus Aminicenantes bacterium]NIT25796.1 hypothetical protein [Candidatus Aminicenantes bacterium]
DVDVSIRRAVAVTLGKIGTSKDILLLKPLLRDRNHWVRNAAALALGDIGTSEHIKLLKPMLSYWYYGINKMSYVDIILIFLGLGIIVIGKAIKNHLKKNAFLCDEDDFSHRTAAEVLGKIGSSKHVRFLKPLLKDKSVYVRKAGAEALGKIGTPKHILLLEPLLFHLNRDVQKAAARSIEQIYRRSNPKLRFIGRILKKSEEKKSLIIKSHPLKSLHILHISDIHYSTENDPSITRIFHEFLKDIKQWREKNHNKPIHAICLTGDIAFSGQKEQYVSIHKRINEILIVTGCPQDRLFLIPGNHDVHEYNNFSEECQQIMDEAVKDETTIDRILSDFKKYRHFYEKFTHYYGYVETSGFTNSHPETHEGNPKSWYSRRLEDFPVRIIGLNSALFCLKPYSKRDKIRMGKSQLEEAYLHEKPLGTEEQVLVLLLTHHPADWLRETEKDEYETMMDRYKFVHLHGHIHRLKPELRSTYSGSTYMLIGTGSIYGEEGTKNINTYHIMTLDFEKQDIHIWGRRWEPGSGSWMEFADTTRNVFPFPGKK